MSTSAPNWRDYLGYTLWTSAFILQTAADYQKLRFKMNPANDVRACV
jgi:steroid 5-alpha reductase family enzyme